MRSIVGQCAKCCECPDTALLCATASASRTKCGYDAGVVVCGTAGRIYSTLTRSGACTPDPVDFCNATQKQTPSAGYFSGATTFDRDTCAEDGSVVYDPCGPVSNLAEQLVEVSDEYTTPDLIDVMLAAVGTPGTPTTCGSAVIASFSLSSDGVTASGKRGDYAFTIPEGISGCYRITWDRVSTPSGGSPTITPMEYIWNGSDTVTPTYSEDVPGDNTATPGTAVAITIENIVVHCRGCA